MYKINVSELAHKDLDQIVSYIAINLASPAAATNFLDKVEECYDYLKHNPLMYAKCQNIRLEKEGYRKIPIKNYILVYKINEKTKTVNILRFFYGAQDYLKLI
ncbi:MAG: type II toxin-antitoxin system RelE/ParE family toxin [Alkaliphilus sp.]|nr:type II toxin-antitoxin system RelE/ParE family toxin [Alkaliphilus sp.]